MIVFNKFGGGADSFTDDQFSAINQYDLTVPDSIASFIENEIMPEFNELTEDVKKDFRHALWYYKEFDPLALYKYGHQYLFPFTFPVNAQEMLRVMWKKLFPEGNG